MNRAVSSSDAHAAPEHGAWGPRAFARLLQRITSERKLAYLVVSDGRSEKCLFYTHGGLRITCVGQRQAIDLAGAIRRHPRFERGWLPEGEVDPEQLERACADNPLLAQISHDARRLVARHELFDLLVWDGAEFTFAPGDPPRQVFDPSLRAVRLSTGVDKVLTEVLGRVDDWKELQRALGPPATTRYQKGPTTPADDDRQAQSLLNSIKANGGDCRLEHLFLVGRRASHQHALRVAERVRELVRAKVLEPATEASGEALSSRKRAEVQSEIEGIEQALQLMIDKLQARRRLALGYQVLGDAGAAVENLRAVGEAYLERGDAEQAIGVFREVLTIVPEAFFARERIATIYEGLKRVPDAVSEWLELARSYARFGLLNRALQRMLNVVRLEPADAGHRRRLIDLREALGDEAGAAQDYAALSELYRAQGANAEAGACLGRSLALAPQDAEVAQRVEALRPAPGRGSTLVVALAWLAVAAAGFVAWSHRGAREDFLAARAAALDAAAAGDFAAAYAALGEYRASYPWQHALGRRAAEAAVAERDLAQGADEAVTRVAAALPGWGGLGFAKDRAQAEARVRRAEALVQEAAGLRARPARADPGPRPRAGWPRAADAGRPRLPRPGPAGEPGRRGPGLGRRAGARHLPAGGRAVVEPRELQVSAPAPRRAPRLDPGLEPSLTLELGPGGAGPRRPWALHPARVAVARARSTPADDQRLRAYDLDDGALEWERALEPYERALAPPDPIRRGVVLLSERRLRVLEDDGQPRWSLGSPPGGMLFLGVHGEQVVLARGRTVRVLSTRDREVLYEATPASPDAGGFTHGQLSGSYAVLATEGGELVALSLSDLTVLRSARPPSPAATTPLLTELGFAVFGEDRRLRLIHDEERWSLSFPQPPAAPLVYSLGAPPTVWVADGQSVAAVELERGRARFSRTFAAPVSDLAVARYAFVATADGAVWCLDPEDGAPRWRHQAQGPARLTATGTTLYVADAAGELVALPVD
ncbi:MAG: PQQ-binding-like beta-propeller repeat protein [Planctomycetota bacterium]